MTTPEVVFGFAKIEKYDTFLSMFINLTQHKLQLERNLNYHAFFLIIN